MRVRLVLPCGEGVGLVLSPPRSGHPWPPSYGHRLRLRCLRFLRPWMLRCSFPRDCLADDSLQILEFVWWVVLPHCFLRLYTSDRYVIDISDETLELKLYSGIEQKLAMCSLAIIQHWLPHRMFVEYEIGTTSFESFIHWLFTRT